MLGTRWLLSPFARSTGRSAAVCAVGIQSSDTRRSHPVVSWVPWAEHGWLGGWLNWDAMNIKLGFEQTISGIWLKPYIDGGTNLGLELAKIGT